MGARPTVVVSGDFGAHGGAVIEALADPFTVWLTCHDDLDSHRAETLGVPRTRHWWIDRSGPDGDPDVPPGLARVHVLVHCASYIVDGSIAEASFEHWMDVFGKDIFTIASVTRRLVPMLRRERGHVIIVHPTTMAGSPVGRASASALRIFADALQDEERASGIHVTEIGPAARVCVIVASIVLGGDGFLELVWSVASGGVALEIPRRQGSQSSPHMACTGRSLPNLIRPQSRLSGLRGNGYVRLEGRPTLVGLVTGLWQRCRRGSVEQVVAVGPGWRNPVDVTAASLAARQLGWLWC